MDYYDFALDGNRIGYFEIEERPGELYMNARLFINGVRHENPFWVRHVDGRPTEVKMGGSDWRQVPGGAFPTSAYPLLLQAGPGPFKALIEGIGEVEDRELRLEGGLFVEYAGERVTRKFRMQGTVIDYICWGGPAESRLVGSKAEAVRGTVFDDAAARRPQ